MSHVPLSHGDVPRVWKIAKRGVRAGHEIRSKCPYCEYTFSVEARDIRGELFSIRCLDCREVFVVEVTCHVEHRVRPLADVDADDLLDALTAELNGEPDQSDEVIDDEPEPEPRKAPSMSGLARHLEPTRVGGKLKL